MNRFSHKRMALNDATLAPTTYSKDALLRRRESVRSQQTRPSAILQEEVLEKRSDSQVSEGYLRKNERRGR